MKLVLFLTLLALTNAFIPSDCGDNVIDYSEEAILQRASEQKTVTAFASIDEFDRDIYHSYDNIGHRSNETKKIIFIDAGIHAREWIAPATALYIIHEFVSNDLYRPFLDKIDFYIAPTINPDGYEYTRNSFRMWRKNRRPNPENETCPGVDLNRQEMHFSSNSSRNSPFEWNAPTNETEYASDPCEDIYKGKAPLSEPETLNLATFLIAHHYMDSYISLHSYSNEWLYPWSYKRGVSDDVDELKSVAEEAVAAAKSVRNGDWRAIPAYDYAKSIGIKYSYTVELTSGKDNVGFFFHVPECHITSVGEEFLRGLLVVAQRVIAA